MNEKEEIAEPKRTNVRTLKLEEAVPKSRTETRLPTRTVEPTEQPDPNRANDRKLIELAPTM
jgi:hypothetical protein